MLPGWYGFGTAVERWLDAQPGEREARLSLLAEMHERWPFFRSVLSNMDMVLAKTDLAIASRYAELVADRARARRDLRRGSPPSTSARVRCLLAITGNGGAARRQSDARAQHPQPLSVSRSAQSPAGRVAAPLPRRADRRADAARHPSDDQRPRRRIAQQRLTARPAASMEASHAQRRLAALLAIQAICGRPKRIARAVAQGGRAGEIAATSIRNGAGAGDCRATGAGPAQAIIGNPCAAHLGRCHRRRSAFNSHAHPPFQRRRLLRARPRAPRRGARAARGDITVVAPERDRSGASNSLTLDRPLTVRRAPNGFLFVNGTPTDCVHLAVTGLLDALPDMVISGINLGREHGRRHDLLGHGRRGDRGLSARHSVDRDLARVEDRRAFRDRGAVALELLERHAATPLWRVAPQRQRARRAARRAQGLSASRGSAAGTRRRMSSARESPRGETVLLGRRRGRGGGCRRGHRFPRGRRGLSRR